MRIKGSKLNRLCANRNSPTLNEFQRASVECGGDSRYNEPSYRPIGLVETGPARQQRATEPDLELVLATGERLRISAGVDPTALRRVLEALRA